VRVVQPPCVRQLAADRLCGRRERRGTELVPPQSIQKAIGVPVVVRSSPGVGVIRILIAVVEHGRGLGPADVLPLRLGRQVEIRDTGLRPQFAHEGGRVHGSVGRPVDSGRAVRRPADVVIGDRVLGLRVRAARCVHDMVPLLLRDLENAGIHALGQIHRICRNPLPAHRVRPGRNPPQHKLIGFVEVIRGHAGPDHGFHDRLSHRIRNGVAHPCAPQAVGEILFVHVLDLSLLSRVFGQIHDHVERRGGRSQGHAEFGKHPDIGAGGDRGVPDDVTCAIGDAVQVAAQRSQRQFQRRVAIIGLHRDVPFFVRTGGQHIIDVHQPAPGPALANRHLAHRGIGYRAERETDRKRSKNHFHRSCPFHRHFLHSSLSIGFDLMRPDSTRIDSNRLFFFNASESASRPRSGSARHPRCSSPYPENPEPD